MIVTSHSPSAAADGENQRAKREVGRLRVALLTNFIPPYRLPIYETLERNVGQLLVLISTRMEANRSWQPDFGTLNVHVQKGITRTRTWNHPKGFSETLYTHFPLDTVPVLRRFRPDVVISGEFGFRTISAAAYRLLFRGSRLIVWGTLSERTEESRGPVREMLRRILTHVADAIVVNGHSGARYLSRFGVDPRRIFLVFTTTDVQAFAHLPAERSGPSAYRMLYSGRLVERKYVLPFLRVLSRWVNAHPERNIEFWLAGDGDQRPQIEREPFPENLKLKFWGDLPYQKLPEIYSQAGVLVFPTMADEWGLVVNEAMAAGVPVMGSVHAQAVEELVEDGETGWSFRPENERETYRAIDRFFSASEEDLNQMRQRARSKVLRLSPEAVIEPLLDAMQYVWKSGARADE